MAVTEHTLPTTNAPPTTAATINYQQQQQYPQMPSVFRAIEYNLQPNYRRFQNSEHGYYWVYQATKTNLSARIYPNIDASKITVLIYDDSKHPYQSPTDADVIKLWSGDLRMTGDWRRRLCRAAGEAIVLANRRPKCPNCKKFLVLRERYDDHRQFFGCEDYPRCTGTIGIIDHDLDRKRAGSYRTQAEQCASQSTTIASPKET